MRSSDVRLEVLTGLGHSLPGARSPAEASTKVVEALAALEVAGIVSAVESDMAVVLAVNIPESQTLLLSTRLAATIVGMRIPLDGVESLRQPVRLRRPYYGVADASETMRRLTTDSALAKALPNAADERDVMAVPVTCRDRVVAVLSVWGPGCSPELGPMLEAVAAMLGGAWSAEAQPGVQRFDALSSPAPDRRLRGTISSMITSGGIVAALQPIVRLVNDTVIGYEALARFPPRARVHTPDQLFGAAAALNMQSAVDLACVRAALQAASNIGEADLFVNVLIGTLVDQSGVAALDKAVLDARVDPAAVVLEFSEREPVPDLALLQRIAAELRARGFRIAVDDAGAGHASMRVIAELRPEFIKVDRSLITAIDADRARRALVVALLSFSGHIGARVIAEGIETQREQETLQSLGVQFGQGWLLGRPVLPHPLKGDTAMEVVDATWFAQRLVSPTRVASTGPEPAAPGAIAPVDTVAVTRPRRGTRPRPQRRGAGAPERARSRCAILGVMAEQMSRVVPVTEMAIFVADYETFRLVPVLATGPDRDEIMADSMALDAGITGWAFAKGTPQNIPDTSNAPARATDSRDVLCRGVTAARPAGRNRAQARHHQLLASRQSTSSRRRELEAASLFAHVAASAWRNAQLYGELVNAAMTDPLTGLYNSRWLRDAGERDIARAARDGKSLSLLLVDLDHFKAVNDSAGHAVGDVVLQRVAAQLRTAVRGADAVVRLGGEEFVVLLHECPADGAWIAAEAVRSAVRDVVVPEGCSLDGLTASIGIATYPEHGGTLDQLLGAADRAMYSAKHEGRDRSVRAVPPAGRRKDHRPPPPAAPASERARASSRGAD